LTIRTASRCEEVVLSVADAGPAIDDAQMARMFQPFYSTKTNGLGMGLSITKSIVESHRGRIWADHNPDAGITMNVAIPQLGVQHVGQ
jgi:C4-dicarboxylate-specific signal transduction histidine kinase